MLEIIEIQRLFTHLREVHPNCPPDKIPRLTNSLARLWIKTFEGYDYQQLEEAIDRRAAVNRFWPDASEIKPYLPPSAKCREQDQALDQSMCEAIAWVTEVGKGYHTRLKAAGYPTLSEALAQGMTCAEWSELTKEVEIYEQAPKPERLRPAAAGGGRAGPGVYGAGEGGVKA